MVFLEKPGYRKEEKFFCTRAVDSTSESSRERTRCGPRSGYREFKRNRRFLLNPMFCPIKRTKHWKNRRFFP